MPIFPVSRPWLPSHGLGIVRWSPGVALDHLGLDGALSRILGRREEVESHLKIEVHPLLVADGARLQGEAMDNRIKGSLVVYQPIGYVVT